MANTINQVDVMNALHNLMGHRVNPGGTDADYQRYIQDAFNYCWRYYRWGFSLKKASVAADGLLPTDFDLEGYRAFNGVTEISLEDSMNGVSGSAVVWDTTTDRYKLDPAVACTVVYQYTPPTLGTDSNGDAPFPSAAVVAIGATVLAKQGANPTRADIQQEWDMWHSRLDRLAGRADNAKPHTPRSYHDKVGSYVGRVQ
jgi:hypothetical protein